jgi:succinoglycan biosynthesis transport protein ExoP
MPPLPTARYTTAIRRSTHPLLLEAAPVQGSYGVSEPWLTIPNVLRLLWRRLGLITLVTCALSLLGIGITLLLPVSYESETLIVVEPRREQISNVPEVVSPLPAENAVLRSEVDALQSSGLIRSVVEHADLTSLPEFNPSLRTISGWNPMSWLAKDEQAALNQKAGSFMQRVGGVLGGGANTPEARRPQDDDAVSVAAAIYRNKALNVSTDGRSLTMRLTIKSSDPELAARLANLHAELYLEQQFTSKVQATERARNWLSERIVPLKSDLQRADAAVQRYREENQLITSSQGMTVTVQQLAELNTQLSLVRSEKAQNQARLDQVRKLVRTGSELESVPDVLASPLVQKLREQESHVARLEADAAARYVSTEHPSIVSARAQLTELRRALVRETNKIATSLQRAVEVSSAKEQSLELALEQLTKRAAAANLSEVKLRELERDAESTRALYQTLLNRHQETSFGPIARLADSRIISAAVFPLKPAFPKYTLFFAASVLFAAAASTGLAFLVDGFQERLHSPTQCVDMLGVRGLGLVPRIGGWRSRRIADCIVSEGMPRDAVRSVLEILRATQTDHKPRSMSITSAVPHEGKTILAIWLARVSAMVGLKVLLVDADLRRPAVAKYLGTKAIGGSTLGAVESGKGFQDLLCEDALTGMHWVTCRRQNDKVQGIAALQDVEKLLQEARDSYDLVIVDSAPILAAPESLSICQMTDGVIFAVHWGHTPPRQARQALGMLRSTKAHLLGAVVTRADVRKHLRYAYGDVGDVYYRHKGYYRT